MSRFSEWRERRKTRRAFRAARRAGHVVVEGVAPGEDILARAMSMMGNQLDRHMEAKYGPDWRKVGIRPTREDLEAAWPDAKRSVSRPSEKTE